MHKNIVLIRIIQTTIALACITTGSLLFPQSSFAQTVTPFLDDFEDNNLDGWTIDSGNWSIVDGKLQSENTEEQTNGKIILNQQWDNFKLEFDVNNITGVDEYIRFRENPETNSYYELNIRHLIPNVFKSPKYHIVKVEGDTRTDILNAHAAYPVINNWYHITLVIEIDNIKLLINNQEYHDLIVSDTDSLVKTGRISFATKKLDGLYYEKVLFDNIKVGPIEPYKQPVILIPGFGGSELVTPNRVDWYQPDGGGLGLNYSNIYQPREKVWVNIAQAILPGSDDYFDILRMPGNGQYGISNLEPTALFKDAYQPTIDYLLSHGYTLDKDLFTFPYDWRKSILTNSQILDRKIEAIKTETSATKVNIIAHSMGGLLAREYIQYPSKAQNVDKLITLGTPHLGAPEFLKQLMYGGCLTSIPGIVPGCWGIPPSEVKDILQNMPGGFQLSPSQKYYEFYSNTSKDSPSPFYDEGDLDYNNEVGLLDYEQTKTFLTNKQYNTNLFSVAEEFHNIDSTYANTNKVQVHMIIGSGLPTTGQIIEKYQVDLAGVKLFPKHDLVKINGDETVPLYSASLNYPTRGMNLSGDTQAYYIKETHSNLIKNPTALSLITNILNQSSNIPSGIRNEPIALKGHLISAHSPVNLHVYDQHGNHTGIKANGDIEINIPGSNYETLDDAKFIWLPEDGIYAIKLDATNQGSFDLKIREYKENLNTQSILYKDIPLTHTTHAEVSLNTATTTQSMQIDTNNDGSFENTVNPTQIITEGIEVDETPPTIQLTINDTPYSNQWINKDAVIQITAEDESEIEKIQYTVDDIANNYTEPFKISSQGTKIIQVKAIDTVGNEKHEQYEIKIDTTAPEAIAKFSPLSQKIETLGIDNHSGIKSVQDIGNEIIIKDHAENTTKIQTDGTNNSRTEKLEIKSIIYNGNPKLLTSKNGIYIHNKQATNEVFNLLNQMTYIKGQEAATALYERKTNKTLLILLNAKNKPEISIKNGIQLLTIKTQSGQLMSSYVSYP